MSTNFNYQEQYPAEVSETRLTELFAGVMQRVYGWMSLGLLVTTVVAILTLSSPTILNLVFGNMIVFWGLVICELILVISVNRAISRLSSGAGLALFFVYAALNGVTLSVIFLAYGLGTIVFAFGTVAAHTLEKILLCWFLYRKFGISLSQYTDMRWFLGYSMGMVAGFVVAVAG